MNESFKIKIIGTGNTATVLGRLLVSKGMAIQSISGRNTTTLYQLAKEWNCRISAIEDILDDGGICLICVSDDSIYEVAEKLQIEHSIVAHTAASADISILPFKDCGILYPLQSLRKERTTIPVIPFLVEANNEATENRLIELASLLSDQVLKSKFQDRVRLHLAAVFVSNFTNHLYAIAHDFCAAENISYTILGPLLKEVAERASAINPNSMQTGPAARGDEKTIQRHQSILEAYPDWLMIYKMMTDSIQKSM